LISKIKGTIVKPAISSIAKTVQLQIGFMKLMKVKKKKDLFVGL